MQVRGVHRGDTWKGRTALPTLRPRLRCLARRSHAVRRVGHRTFRGVPACTGSLLAPVHRVKRRRCDDSSLGFPSGQGLRRWRACPTPGGYAGRQRGPRIPPSARAAPSSFVTFGPTRRYRAEQRSVCGLRDLRGHAPVPTATPRRRDRGGGIRGLRPAGPVRRADQEHAARLVELVDAGRCPRCGAALPTLPEFPAGSQVTDCRCIPISARCGRDEAILWLMWVKKEGGDWPSPDARDWPIPEADVLRRLKWSEDNSTRVMIEAGDLDLPESTSGWAAFGYDDTEDRDERGR